MSINRAAWLMSPKASKLEVKEAPYPSPGSNDVVVKVDFVAINPLEYKIQDDNPKIGGKEISYPTVLGADVSGHIVSVGANVSRWKPGVSVIGNMSGLGKTSAAFQHFIQVNEDVLDQIPPTMPLEHAVVLPLACDTASAGLFTAGTLGLSTARLVGFQGTAAAKEVLLVWGGSSSVGCCAIQLARAAGYEVFTTASKRNHDLCSSIGASKVFDYNSESVEQEIIEAMKGTTTIGALDCISHPEKTIPACARILSEAQGQKKVMTVLTPSDVTVDETVSVQRLSIPAYLGTDEHRDVHTFIAAGLQDGRLHPKPDPLIIGTGLDLIQAGIDAVRQGQSATKIVVRLSQ